MFEISSRRSATPKRRGGRGGSGSEAATAERLVAVAAVLFAERGRDGVSVRDLCGAARANVAAVAYHFGGKDGLYLEALRESLRRMRDRVDPLLKPDDPDPATRLRAHVDAFASCLLDAPAHEPGPRLVLRELASPSPALRRVVAEFMKPNFLELRAGIEAVAAPRTPEETIGFAAVGVVAQFVHARHAAPVVRAQLGLGAAYPPGFAAKYARHVYVQLVRAVGRDDLASAASRKGSR